MKPLRTLPDGSGRDRCGSFPYILALREASAMSRIMTPFCIFHPETEKKLPFYRSCLDIGPNTY